LVDDYDFYATGIAGTVKPENHVADIRKDYNAAITILGEKENINRELISLYKKNLTLPLPAFANEFRDQA
jgi:hypothetical protein